jgi:hypothetical protein
MERRAVGQQIFLDLSFENLHTLSLGVNLLCIPVYCRKADNTLPVTWPWFEETPSCDSFPAVCRIIGWRLCRRGWVISVPINGSPWLFPFPATLCWKVNVFIFLWLTAVLNSPVLWLTFTIHPFHGTLTAGTSPWLPMMEDYKYLMLFEWLLVSTILHLRRLWI